MRFFYTLVIFLIVVSLSAQITNVRKWRKSEVDSLDYGLILYDDGLYPQAVPIFENIKNNHPKEEFIKYTFAKCALYRSDKHEEAYLILTELYPKYNDISDMNYDIALGALYNMRLDEADQYIAKFMATKRLSLQDKRKADALKKNIYYARYYTANPTNAKIIDLGPNINTEGDEYVPSITADQSMMVFTYNGEKSIGGRQNENLQPDNKGFFMEDIYFSKKEGNDFAKAAPIDSLNTSFPDAAISLSIDGRILYVYQDLDDGHGDIYKCEWLGDTYSHPKKLKGLNSYSWDGHCSMAPDGKTLYFSSERVGGYGGRDIYKATMQADSSWGDITNLGDSINTRFDEDAPFIYADDNTLFFSSKGRTSMGGYDIFKTVYNPKDSTFGYSENLGYPINSTDDDIYFVLAADGQTGYYSSGKKGGKGLKDIYKVETNFAQPVSPVYLLKGKLSNAGVPVEADVMVLNTSNSSPYASLKSQLGTGFYLSTLPVGANYKVNYNYNGNIKSVQLDLTSLTSYTQSVVDIDFNVKGDSVLPILVPTTEPVLAGATTPSIPPAVLAAAPASAAAASKTVSPKPANTATVSPAIAAVGSGLAVAGSNVPNKPKDNFVPKTKYQEKTVRYVEKYGDISAPGLEFKVQFAAFKSGKNYAYPNLSKVGKIDRVLLGDGYTRLVIGGTFKTLKAAWPINKKTVNAGETEAFVQAFYNGKRTSFEELEKLKIFVEK